ncbi:DUF3396 domain-containing protein [Archangium violaceum]|uniref:type VI immunity family protein n=1 Tax=Archangium violaceum TaxID=83451 RepID=UPI002B2F8368|nr:DUF3396 domain-containing protein [Archangium violaceum]
MTELYPRIRRYGPTPTGERLLCREVVRIVFYLPHDHVDLAAGVGRALDSYMRAVGEGPDSICGWASGNSEYSALDAEQWGRVRYLLRPERPCRFADDYDEEFLDRMETRGFETYLSLSGDPLNPTGHAFSYWARVPWRSPAEDSVSVLSATLPTEALEVHGPGWVRALAMEMASHLRFATGHAGLAFGFWWPRSRLMAGLREEVFRYPGMDVPRGELLSSMGTRVDDVHWLNFLSQPVLGKVGGAAGLRARLHTPETSVHELDDERVVVTLGQWPEAGDLQQGRDLPAYRELARALEPWLDPFLSVHASSWRGYTEEEVRRWWRRFLDLPD